MIDSTKLKYLGSGRNRDVYLLPSGKNVIKIPRNEAGEHANWFEARHRTTAFSCEGTTFAHCHLIPGTHILVMEYLKEVSYSTLTKYYRHYKKQKVPVWVDFIDCQQVGFSRNGVLKAFDWERY